MNDCPLENAMVIDQPSLYKHFPEAEAVWVCMACGNEANRVETPEWSRCMRSVCCGSQCYNGA